MEKTTKKLAALLMLFAGLLLCVKTGQAKPVEAMPAHRVAADFRPILSFMESLASSSEAQQSVPATPNSQTTAPPAEIPLPDGKGKDLTLRLCGRCHSMNIVVQQRHTRDQWSSIIDNMVSKGLVASDDELDEVTDYLVTSFPATPKADPATQTAPGHQ